MKDVRSGAPVPWSWHANGAEAAARLGSTDFKHDRCTGEPEYRMIEWLRGAHDDGSDPGARFSTSVDPSS